jgi:hypothetical protein
MLVCAAIMLCSFCLWVDRCKALVPAVLHGVHRVQLGYMSTRLWGSQERDSCSGNSSAMTLFRVGYKAGVTIGSCPMGKFRGGGGRGAQRSCACAVNALSDNLTKLVLLSGIPPVIAVSWTHVASHTYTPTPSRCPIHGVVVSVEFVAHTPSRHVREFVTQS